MKVEEWQKVGPFTEFDQPQYRFRRYTQYGTRMYAHPVWGLVHNYCDMPRISRGELHGVNIPTPALFRQDPDVTRGIAEAVTQNPCCLIGGSK
jgi:hypothetical protein